MRKYIFCLNILLMSTSIGCSQKAYSSYLQMVSNDFSRNSYFIILNVIIEGQKGVYVIENDDLFYYYHQTKFFNEEQYKKHIIPLLSSQRSITISSLEMSKYGFVKIAKASQEIESDSTKGIEYFIKRYFSGRVLNDNISNDNRNSIIKILSNWGIASRIDDETGYLIIAN